MTGSLALMALALSFLGYPEQALRRSHEALSLAQKLDQPYSLANALNFAGELHIERGDGRVAQERADAVVTLCSEHGFSLYLAWGTILRGCLKSLLACQAAHHDVNHGDMNQGLAGLRVDIHSPCSTGDSAPTTRRCVRPPTVWVRAQSLSCPQGVRQSLSAVCTRRVTGAPRSRAVPHSRHRPKCSAAARTYAAGAPRPAWPRPDPGYWRHGPPRRAPTLSVSTKIWRLRPLICLPAS